MSAHTDLAIAALTPELLERVLGRLGYSSPPPTTLEGLESIYAAWCRRVAFDNVRKIIHVQSGDPGPLPGSTPTDFFEGWLRYGTGGTCWSGTGALHALLVGVGFPAIRGVATMLAAPNLPPNHATVMVTLDRIRYLVDNSMLFGEPLQLEEHAETNVAHPAWGVNCSRRENHWYIAWRPLHKLDGFECRLERFGATAEEYRSMYEKTRGWSPFNYEVTARINRGDDVVGVSFGHAVTLHGDGRVSRSPVTAAQRAEVLVEQLGLTEEIVSRLPLDVPTPPPPGSQTARAQA